MAPSMRSVKKIARVKPFSKNNEAAIFRLDMRIPGYYSNLYTSGIHLDSRIYSGSLSENAIPFPNPVLILFLIRFK